ERVLDLENLIRGRRSVRRLRTDPVPRDLVERVLDAGRWAPSPHGTQPWRFAVLTEQAAKLRVTDAMATTWEHNLAMDGQSASVIAGRIEGSRRRMMEAPVLIFVCLYL